MDLFVDQQAITAQDGDDVLTALIRAGHTPAGCLCLAGDCPNCLATIDGVPYRRMCQTDAAPGMDVQPFPVSEPPSMPTDGSPNAVVHRSFEVDLVVIGAGESGTTEAEQARAAGRDVVTLDPRFGSEALAIYPGPEVICRRDGEIHRLHPHEVVVATGRIEIQPVAEGSHLPGILTRRAAERLAAAGVDLGRVEEVTGPVLRFEGSDRVEAVVVAQDGGERRYPCDTAVVDMGTYPRDVLARMARDGEVRTAGGLASEPEIPACPTTGTICPCSGVGIEDLDFVWERGFRELELIKRATLAGTGTCQGGVCTPYLRSFVADRGGQLQPTFTARPLARQMTIGEAAAAVRFPPVHRTGLDSLHRSLGARMDHMGGWWRPWTYGDDDAGYRAVREGVSLCDVGTLGKMLVRGPDAVDFLERLYPCRVGDLAPGRSRYALLLAESGGLLDDGLIARVDDNTFALTVTSGGASMAEAWIRDWAAAFDANVRIMDRTHSLGAINVTGPRATELVERAGLDQPLSFMRHTVATLAGVPCRVYRLSFTGEISYELHHPYARSLELWEGLTELGGDLNVVPHGLHTLQTLRLEKGHIIVGMDTEPDSTPRRLGMEWAVKMDKEDFVGRAALDRTSSLPLDRQLVGLTMDAPAPVDGTPLYRLSGEPAGYVTSAAWSPTLDRVVMLAWVDVEDGETPDQVAVDERIAHRTDLPFYDPEGARARG